jgi:hypothetical protein
MFCSFDRKPWILRLYGQGQVIRTNQPDWDAWAAHFPETAGQRQIIAVHVESAQTSCGYSIPFFEFKGQRDVLVDWALKKSDEALENYRLENNSKSIDGLPTGYPGE